LSFILLEFVKNPESLPKTGHGFLYGLGVRKMLPLAGNHAAEYTRKRYDAQGLNRYEGNSYRAGVRWVHPLKAGTAISVGEHYQKDALNDKIESSKTLALRLGGSYRTEGGLNTQVSLHVGERTFDAKHPLFGMTRRDKELIGSVGIWHRKLSVMGVTPKLVYRFSEIRSNISALYSRQSRGGDGGDGGCGLLTMYNA